MKTWLHNLRQKKSKKKQAPRTARPELECLEERVVPAITDMTQVAQLFAPHSGPTHLYLNFDGWNDKSHSIAAFTGSAQAIQDIFFRTAEVFAPFDVEVSRITGDGVSAGGNNGSSTIFIGADSSNVNRNGKFPGAFTPGANSDYPGVSLGDTHQPNSNPSDIAFVDPVGQNIPGPGNPWVTVLSAAQITRAVVHEAGHTFGLAHVRTDKAANGQFNADPTALGAETVRDVMDYAPPAIDQFFANQTLPLTRANFDPATGKTNFTLALPKWHGTSLTTQNSFTYLESVLGDRPDDGNFHVAYHIATGSPVDPSYTKLPPAMNLLGNSVTGSVNREGDYEVYRLDVPQTGKLDIDLADTGNPSLVPVLLIFDSGGNLLNFADSRPNNTGVGSEIHLDFAAQAGQSLSFVVGAAEGNTTGSYTLQITPPPQVGDVFLLRAWASFHEPLSVQISFNKPIGSFHGTDITYVPTNSPRIVVPDAAIRPIDASHFVVSLGNVPLSGFTLTLGPNIRDPLGHAMTAAWSSANRFVHTDRPQLASAAAVTKDIRATFSQAIDAATFNARAIASLKDSYGQPLTVTRTSPVDFSGGTAFDIHLTSAPRGGFDLTLLPTIIDLWGNSLDPTHRQLSVTDRTQPHLLQIDLLDLEPWGQIVNRVVNIPLTQRELVVTFDKSIDTDTFNKNRATDVVIKDPTGHAVPLTDVVPVFAIYPQPQDVQFSIWFPVPVGTNGTYTLEVTTNVTDVYANPLVKQYDLPFKVLPPLTTSDLPLSLQDKLEQLVDKLAKVLTWNDPRNPPDPKPDWNQDIAHMSSILTWATLEGDKMISFVTDETLRTSEGTYKDGVGLNDQLRDHAMMSLIEAWRDAGLIPKDGRP